MESQTQNDHLIQCRSCLDCLPHYLFGVSRNSSNGRNQTCRPCRNIIKKFNYKSGNVDIGLLPITKKNSVILNSIFKTVDGILDINIKAENNYLVKINFNKVERFIQIYKDGTILAQMHFCGADLAYEYSILYEYLLNHRISLIPN